MMNKSKTSNKGIYYWTKDSNGNDMLIIEVNDNRWKWGSLVLYALKNMMNSYPLRSLEEAVEVERRHWGGWEMDGLRDEFEVLKQTPEYKALEEAYQNRDNNRNV